MQADWVFSRLHCSKTKLQTGPLSWKLLMAARRCTIVMNFFRIQLVNSNTKVVHHKFLSGDLVPRFPRIPTEIDDARSPLSPPKFAALLGVDSGFFR